MVDKISRFIFFLIVILVLVSVLATYIKFVVLSDFEIIDDLEETSEVVEDEGL